MAEALSRIPKTLKWGLMPFQWEGVRFALQRNTRCLIGDEMGASPRLYELCCAASSCSCIVSLHGLIHDIFTIVSLHFSDSSALLHHASGCSTSGALWSVWHA